MTGLLVSVRNAREAEAALRGGADIVDVKEPKFGSLGAASADVWQQVATLLNGQALLSVACGELIDFEPDQGARLPESTSFAKIGLAGCAGLSDWPDRWRRAWECLSVSVQRVAVCYVDQQRAQSPSWQQILEQAPAADCKCLLLDTFDKLAGNLLTHWSRSQLARVVDQAAAQGLFVVAAGSLANRHLGTVYGAGVRFVAVRGAVCRTGRTGPLDGDLVKELRAACDATLATVATD